MDNYIYVLSFNGAVKIGKTYNLEQRIQGHRTSNPFFEVVHTTKCDALYEKYLHFNLKDYKLKGCTEWFKYYEGIYEDIKNWLTVDLTNINYSYYTVNKNGEEVPSESFLNLLEEGFTNQQIGERFNVTEAAVRIWLKRYNLTNKRVVNKSAHYRFDYEIEDILRLKFSGKTNQNIGDIYGMSEGNVRKIINKNRYGTR